MNMNKIKIFKQPVKDEYGGSFEAAVVKLWAVYDIVKTSRVEDEKDGFYSVTNGFTAITYHASFWYDDETKADPSIRSRPLITLVDGELTDTFSVDMTNPVVIAILNGPESIDERVINAAKADVRYRSS